VKISRSELLESIERASLLARDGKNNLIRISVGDTSMTVTSRSEEGNVKEEITIAREGDGLEIGFNSKYLLDVLKVISDDEVHMEFNSSVSPCMVKPVDGDTYEYLILPVRIPTM
jgi:DNA polymerase-3 subunit beta